MLNIVLKVSIEKSPTKTIAFHRELLFLLGITYLALTDENNAYERFEKAAMFIEQSDNSSLSIKLLSCLGRMNKLQENPNEKCQLLQEVSVMLKIASEDKSKECCVAFQVLHVQISRLITKNDNDQNLSKQIPIEKKTVHDHFNFYNFWQTHRQAIFKSFTALLLKIEPCYYEALL